MEKRPVERGSSPRELKKARRSIMKQGTVGVQREPTQRFDARKSRVSFGGDHIKVFGRDSSENSNGTLEVTGTETVQLTAPSLKSIENKENVANSTLDMVDLTMVGQSAEACPEFSFEIDQPDPRRNSLQTQNIFTGGITMPVPMNPPAEVDDPDSLNNFTRNEREIAEKTIQSPLTPKVDQNKPARLEPTPSPMVPPKSAESDELPPITPISEPRKKRRSLLEMVQRNNLIRQQSPSLKTPTRTISKPTKQLIPHTGPSPKSCSQSPELGKKKAKQIISMFNFGPEEESEDEDLEDEPMRKENQTIRGDLTMNMTANQTMNQTCRMDKTVLAEQTMAMEVTMNQTVDKTADATAKVFSKLNILDSKLSKKPKKPAGLPIPTESPASTLVPEDSPKFQSPVQLTEQDLERIASDFKREQQRQLLKEPPASPFTPNRAQTSLRKKLMKSRESIGLAKAKRIHGPDIVRSPAPESPVTRSRSKVAKLANEIKRIEDSPVTRSMQKKVVTMQEEKSKFILPPVTPVDKSKMTGLDTSNKPFSNLPEMSGIAQLTNTSITGFNIDDISADNFIQGDQDSIKFDTDVESLNPTPEASVYLQNVTVDNPATKLISKSNTLMEEKVEDSFDYTRALEQATSRMVPAEFTDPVNDSKIEAKNEAFTAFIARLQGLFGPNEEIDFKIAETELELTMPFSRREWKDHKLDEIFVNQMKERINKIRPTETECHQIAKYSEDKVQNIDLEDLQKKTVKLAHHKYLTEIIKMTKAKCSPDKKIEELSAQSVKLEELASTLDLERVKADGDAHKKKIAILETKKNDLQTLQEETSSLSERIAGLKAEIANQKKKSLEDNSEAEAERRLKEMSQKYNFHYWGGNFYFCNGYLKYCPESKVFSYNRNVMNRPAWIFHLGNFANTQNLIQHLVELIARKLMSFPTLKQQAEMINRVWTQLERFIKSYHITMLASKFPSKLKINLEGFILEKFIRLKDNVVQVEWSFIISPDGLELQHGKQTQSMFPSDESYEEIDAKASSLDVNLDNCLEKCINSFYDK